VFPALDRARPPGAIGERLWTDGEAACFHHADKRAVVACGACGRFLCALCDLPVGAAHYCPDCLHKATRQGGIRELERQRIRYDEIALSVAVLSWLVCFLGILTAPVIYFLIARGWKQPPSLVERTRLRLVVAGVLATGGLVVSGWMIFAMWSA
jgi:hypothetical protein